MKLKKVSAHVAFNYEGQKPFIFNMNRLNPTVEQLTKFKELFDEIFQAEILRQSKG